MPDSFDYTTGTNSENVRLLQALIDEAPEYTEETNSRNANILKSIINNTEYTDAPQSEIEELLLRLKAKIGGEIEVDELNVTENGTYDAGVNKAYNPVTVELPLNEKTITENGTYTASDDNLAGFNEVIVAVEGYAKKSIENTPTAIANFTDGAEMVMPSLIVGVDAWQEGSGDPSPSNVRPIHGWDEVNVSVMGKNLLNSTSVTVGYIRGSDGEFVSAGAWKCSVEYTPIKPNTSYVLHKYQTSSSSVAGYALYDKNKNYISGNNYGSASSITINTPSNAMYVRASWGGEAETPVALMLPTAPSDYVPYTGHTYTIDLNGTRYGGYVEIVNGVARFVGTHGYVDMGSLPWGMRSETTYPYFYCDNRSMFFGSGQYIISSAYSDLGSMGGADFGELSANTGYSRGVGSNSRIFKVRDMTYADVESFKTAVTGQQLVYELAETVIIPLGNYPISSLVGVNNLWADSGDVQSGEYFVEL